MESEAEKEARPAFAPIISNPLFRWLLLLGAYTLVLIYDLTHFLAVSLAKERRIDWQEETLESFLFWAIWLLLTPLILRFARAFPFEKRRLPRRIALHLLVLVVVTTIQYSAYLFFEHLIIKGIAFEQLPSLLPGHFSVIVGGIFRNIYYYWIIVGTYYAVLYSLKFRERERAAADLEIRASQLETRLAVARLEALRMQLHPHFLFNTLNTISVLMKENVDKANRMLLRLSELLRVSLEEMSGDCVPLEQELAFSQKYLQIEQVRFEDRLHVEVAAGADVLGAEVPNLLLQPIVENAIRHGISRSSSAGNLIIRAERDGENLRLEVLDDGPGLSGARLEELKQKGIGLANTIKRLEQLYGDGFSFTLENREPIGARALIVIPYRAGR